MCSMPLTVVVSARSKLPVKRCLHLVRREARVLPDDRDDRDVDLREDVRRRLED